MAFVFENPVDNDEPLTPPLYPELDPKTRAPRFSPEPPTVLANRYGFSDHPIFINTGKSGITPILPPDSNRVPPLSPNSLRRARFHEGIQRSRLTDFATWELVDSGCWMNDDAKPCDLDEVPIHAIYQQGNWVDGNIPIGLGVQGVWEGKNPVVWDAILPSLRLATLLIQASPLSPWLDALMYGPRQLVPTSEMASPPLLDGTPDHSFHLRPHEEFMNDVKSQPKLFDDLFPRMRLGIASSNKTTECNLIENTPPYTIGGTSANAITQPLTKIITRDGARVDALQGIFTAIHLEMLEPLLRIDLTSSERLAQQCYLGILLVHETMHAMGIWKRAMSSDSVHTEPFFGDEAVAELGYSWEKAMFTHGRLSPLFQAPDERSRPVLGLVIDSWPQWFNFALADPRGLTAVRRRREELFDLGSTATVWPLHISFIENLLQFKYWTTFVENFGLRALQPPRITGRRWIRTGPGADNLTVYGPDYHSWVTTAEPSIPVTGDEAEIWEAAQRIKLRTDVLNTAMRRQKVDEEIHRRDLELVKEWETRRRNHPLPIVAPQDVGQARLRIELRRTEVEETEVAIAAQHLTPADVARTDAETKEWKDLAKEMLEDAIDYYEQGDTVNTFEHCVGVLGLMRETCPEERFLSARAHSLLGMLGVLRARDHLHAAIDIYRSFQATEVPGIDGHWRDWIQESQSVLDQLDQRQLEAVRQMSVLEQAQIDLAIKLAWVNDQEQAAGICYKLLRSQFTSTRAQAHLVLARLEKTPDKIYHAKASLVRLQRLVEEAPGERDWASMITAVVWVLNPPPPWINMDELDDIASQTWVDYAQHPLATRIQNNEIEALKICLTFSASAYLSIRAQCHFHLSQMRLAGDQLFRRLEAFQALADLEKLRSMNPNNPMWQGLLLQLYQMLGGSTKAEWQANVAADDLSIEQIVKTTSQLTV